MPDELQRPSEIAFAKLRERIAQDASIPDAVRAAFLTDLETENFADFVALRAVLENPGA
jgi:hypothetical protein